MSETLRHDDDETAIPASADDNQTTFSNQQQIKSTDDSQTTIHNQNEHRGPDDTQTTFSNKNDDRLTTIGRAGEGGDSVPVPSAPPSQSERLEINEAILNGRYVIDQALPSGMEADAYRGHSTLTSQTVFVKHFRAFRRNRKFVEKKAAMRDLMFRIDHPNCIRLLDAEISLDRVIEVYEFVEARPLTDLLKEFRSIPDRSFVVELLSQLAAGLNHLHQQLGVAHRDLKPDNILCATGTPFTLKISDYGTATAVDEGGQTAFEGTRRYAPPESLRRSLLRDSDLMALDWWSVGRIVQEIVDGEHAYDRIASKFPKLAGSGDVQALFDAILSEQERELYGVRAGMVEWSTPEWQPLLRGLLTTKRQYRWGYAEVADWLAGKTPPDSYDTAADIEPFVFKNQRYDLHAAARVLAQKENWDEACRQILERDGIVRYIEKELGNKRLQTRIAGFLAFYDNCIARFGEVIAENLTTALTLKAIAGESMPFSMAGVVVTLDTWLQFARDGDRKWTDALISDDFLGSLAPIDPGLSQEFYRAQELVNNVKRVLSGMGDRSGEWMSLTDEIAVYAFAEPEEIRSRFARAKETYARVQFNWLNAIFNAPSPSQVEMAILVWLATRHPQTWQFVTKEAEERENALRLYQRTQNVGKAYAWAVLRKYGFASSALYAPWWIYTIAGLVTGGFFWFYSIIVLLIARHVLRKTLARFHVLQDGEGAWFKGILRAAGCNRLICEYLELQSAPTLQVIEGELDENNRKLEAFAASGHPVQRVPKQTTKFGFLAVATILICLAVPMPLTILLIAINRAARFSIHGVSPWPYVIVAAILAFVFRKRLSRRA